MAAPFPSTYDTKCTGFSLVLSQSLLLAAAALFGVDYDHYNIEEEAQIIELHNVLSSAEHRAQIELACAMVWLAFPFLLISLHGLKKLMTAMFIGTNAENLIFMADKAYTMYIFVLVILMPALALASVSFEWSIHEYTPDDDFVPTGYYMQAYTMLLIQEIFDTSSIAEGAFTIALGLLPRYASFLASRGHPVFSKWCGQYKVGNCGSRSRCCWELTTVLMFFICTVIFLIALFEFAESGFFSINGKGKFLLGLSYVIKLLFGFRLLYFGFTGKQKQVERLFAEGRAEQGQGREVMTAGQQQWKMETLNQVETPREVPEQQA